jgi:hypothetical protein
MTRDRRRPYRPAWVLVILLILLALVAIVAQRLGVTWPWSADYDTPRVTNIEVGFTGPLYANERGVWINTQGSSEGVNSTVELSRIDPRTNGVHQGPTVGAGVVVATENDDLWAIVFHPRGPDRLQRFDGDTLRPKSKQVRIDSFIIHPKVLHGSVWAMSEGDILRVDNETARVTRIKVPGFALRSRFFGAAVFASGEDSVWVSLVGESGRIVRVDPQTNRVVDYKLQTGPCTTDLAVGYDSVWVLDRCWNALLRIDPDSGHLEVRAAAGGDPQSLVLAGGFVWITNGQPGTVTRIHASTGERVGPRIDVDGVPQHITAGAGAVWVAPQGDTLVSRIDFESGD